jgi:hypothetical protein
MTYAYKLKNGGVAHAALLSSVPEGVDYIEVETNPDAPRVSWIIKNGKLTFDKKKKEEALKIKRKVDAKLWRATELDSLVHEFSDGRKIQIRLQDTQSIKDAIELLETTAEDTRDDWIMEDNTLGTLTLAEFKEARLASLVGVATIFKAYNSKL